MKVLEIGGGLCGFQFVLSQTGCAVTNVDPGLSAAGIGWPVDDRSMDRLNRTFGTSVELKNSTIEKADLKSEEFDRVFSISVLEHVPYEDLKVIMAEAYRLLRPGGRFIVTVDLFLDVAPFAKREANRFGRNQNVEQMVALMPFRMVQGIPAELYGFKEFDPNAIQERLADLLIGEQYPALTQCIVLEK